jgi:hypothetical protein
MAANANLLRTALAVPNAAAAAPAAAAAGAPRLVTSDSIIEKIQSAMHDVQTLKHNSDARLQAKDNHITNMKLLAEGVRAELTKTQSDLAKLFAEHETAKTTLDTMVMFCFACSVCVCC